MRPTFLWWICLFITMNRKDSWTALSNILHSFCRQFTKSLLTKLWNNAVSMHMIKRPACDSWTNDRLLEKLLNILKRNNTIINNKLILIVIDTSPRLLILLKCPWDQNFRTSFFSIFVFSVSPSPTLPNFSLDRAPEISFFGPLNSRFRVRHYLIMFRKLIAGLRGSDVKGSTRKSHMAKCQANITECFTLFLQKLNKNDWASMRNSKLK